MKPNLPNILTFLLVFLGNLVGAQEVWRESFSIPGKGIWGDSNSSMVYEDFEGVTRWELDFSNVSVADENDYAKTVSTSDGRFECRDINGEVIWRSEEIDISEYNNVEIRLTASETGSGANEQNKYLKAFYKIDGGEEMFIENNGENLGNWGSALAEQKEISGQKLQIVVYMNNHYASDKVILDEVVVLGEVELIPINQGDILISEVLFNPAPDGSDYVELYNNSGQEIPVNQLYLASRDKNLELTQIYPLSEKRYLFQPESYLALTKDTNGVFPYFTIECFNCFLQMNKFPSFNNDNDHVVLLNEKMEVIDELYYTDKLHNPILADEDGIALERISFEMNSDDPKIWHSASTESGYGTPGYENSQIQYENINSPIVTFEPESFSPNSDGHNDEYKIEYQLENNEYNANVWVFDSTGREIIQLASNEIMGTSGEITWNGEDENGQKQRLGVYVVLVEIFDLEGNVYRFKDGVVLTDVLE